MVIIAVLFVALCASVYTPPPSQTGTSLFLGVLAYALFGGADFGSGFFDLTAGGATGGAEMRSLVDHSIGPVWEANHVWLIFCLVTWWTGSPEPSPPSRPRCSCRSSLRWRGCRNRSASFATARPRRWLRPRERRTPTPRSSRRRYLPR
jgi:hypothetical protein